jgi:hypothetical protein
MLEQGYSHQNAYFNLVIPAKAGIQKNTIITKTSGYRIKSGMTKKWISYSSLPLIESHNSGQEPESITIVIPAKAGIQ